MTPAEPAAASTSSELSQTLRHYAEILRKRLWIILAIIAVGVTGTVLYTMRQPKIYEASATIIINPQAPRVNKGEDVIEIGAGQSYAETRDFYNTQIEVIRSFPIARATVLGGELTKYYDRIAPRGEYPALSDEKRIDLAADIFLGMMTAIQHRDSRVVAINVRSTDAEFAQVLANAHVTSYMASLRTKRTVGTGAASQVLSIQLDSAQKTLREAEDKITAFKTKHDLITQSFDDKQNTVVSELQRYTTALAESRIKRIEFASQRKRAMGLADMDVLESPIFALGTNLTMIDQLKAEYVKASQHYIEVNAVYGPKTDENKAAKDKLDKLHAQLTSEAKRTMAEIEERYQAVAGAEAGYEQLVAQRRKDAEELDKVYAEYAPLLRDLKSAEDQYAKLNDRLGTSRQEGQNGLINVEPDELARSSYLVLPKMRTNVMLAVILSLLVGVGIAILLDHVDRTIKSVDGVEALVGSPLLGIIPILTEVPTDDTANAVATRDLYVYHHPTSQAAECCRSIRTNILFAAAERQMKSITVSSPRPREGKTTTTIYLGTIMAQSGQKVLLIDTDLRRPRLHKSLGVSRERGLTSLLLGDSNYDDVIKSTEVPNLFVLPCGPLPPNPAELLLTKRFKTVLDELSERFDRILLDSPPLLAVTDGVVLSRVSDGVILVAQAGKTFRDDVAMAARQLRDVNAPILGTILNIIDITDRRYGGYYYAYGGYGEGQPGAEASPTT